MNTVPTDPPRTIIPRILRIGAPLLAGNLSMYLYRLADSVMIGRLGVDALAGIAVATVYTAVHEMFIWPTALGTQALASRRFGRENHDRRAPAVREVLPQAVYAGLVAGLFAAGLSLFAGILVPQFAAAATDDAVGYVRISRLAFPAMGVAAGVRGYLAAVHRTRIIMTAVVASNIANVLLNAVFIFGLGPAPALGVRGAAIGTVAAHALSALILASAVLTTRVDRATPLRPSRIMIRRILEIGFPVAIQNAVAMAMILAYQWILGSIGAVFQAVTHVLFSTFRVNKTLVGGFANGASILVGNALGRGEQDHARAIVRSQQAVAGLIGGVIFLFVLLFPHLVADLFSLTGDSRRVLAEGLRFFAPFFLIEVLAYSLEIIFTHNGWGRFVLVSEVSTNVLGILLVSSLSVFVFSFGYRGAWAGFAAYQLSHALILYGGLRSGRWVDVSVEEQHA